MKKWISLVLCMLLALSCTAISPALAQESAVLEIGTISGTEGSRVRVPVTLKNAGALKSLGNGNVCGIEFNLSYDQSLARLVAVISDLPAVNALGGNDAWSVDSREYAGENRAKIMLSDPYNKGFDAAGDVEIAVLVFDLSDTKGKGTTVTFTPELVDICDNAPHRLTERVSVSAGTVTVVPKQYASLSGGAASAFPGQWVSVFLTLNHAEALSAECNGSNAGNGTLCGLEMDLQYDVKKLTGLEVKTQLASFEADGWYAKAQQQPDGQMKLLVEDQNRVGVAAKGDIVICELRFFVAEDVSANTKIHVACTLVDICDAQAKQLGEFVQTDAFEITVEEKTISDAAANVIGAIQQVSKVTSLGARENVCAARAAYELLSEEDKAQVSNYADLLAAEAKVAELEIAKAKELIAAIGEVSLEKESAIVEARNFYDGLSADQQQRLAAEKETLHAAEQQLAALKPSPGDIDGDGNVTVSDVVELRKVIVSGAWDGRVFSAGNLDGDGTLSVSDVVELRQMIVAGSAL